MATDPRHPTTKAVNSRLLILPFCMDAIVHKHAVTLRQLPGNIFDVRQSGSLGHYRSPSLVFYGRPIFWPPLPHNADRFNAFKKRIDVRQSLIETNLVQLFMKVAYSGSHKGASTANNNSKQKRRVPTTLDVGIATRETATRETAHRQSKTYNGHTKHQSNSLQRANKTNRKRRMKLNRQTVLGVLTRTRVRFTLIGFQKGWSLTTL
jgi:hypothetical protein